MPTANITDRFLKSVQRPASGFVRYWDEKTKGFLVHVYRSKITFYYERNNQRHLIGAFPTVSVPNAREAARELDFKTRRGYAKRIRQADPTMSELVDHYCARPSLRSEKWRAFVRHAIEV
ncbi:MAG: integrase arm-type DNA-binding domain-containing protein [Hyphomonas sp.]